MIRQARHTLVAAALMGLASTAHAQTDASLGAPAPSVRNVSTLAASLGGTRLYGEKPQLAVRELLQIDSLQQARQYRTEDGDYEIPLTRVQSLDTVTDLVNTVEAWAKELDWSTRRIEKPEVRLSFDRQDDMHVMTFSNTLEGMELPYLEGEGELVVTVPPLKLTSDFFLANVAVRENRHGKLLVAQIVGHFHVRHPTYSSTAYGVLHEAGKWSHVPALAAATPTKAAS